MHNKISIILLLLLSWTSTYSQQFLRGKVVDAFDSRGIAYAKLLVNDSIYKTNIDGTFEINLKQAIKTLQISCGGYISKSIQPAFNSFQIITLERESIFIPEILLNDSEEAASQLLAKVLNAKAANDPLKKLQTFEIEAYNKIVVTADSNRIIAKLDTIFKRNWIGKKRMVIDSSSIKFKSLLEKQHLFEAEKVSKYQLSKGVFKETITAARMSGLQTPIYELIAFRLQSFSIYDEYYEILQTKYTSPLNKNAHKNFFVKIIDTTKIDGRTVAALYFESVKENKAGLRGILYCDLDNYAIASAVIGIQGVLNVGAKYDFEYNEREGLYILRENQFKVVKGTNDRDISILGETFQFDPDNSPMYKTRKQQLTDITYLESKTYFSAAKLNTAIAVKKYAIALQINDAAISKPQAFWDTIKAKYPDERSAETYRMLDSLARAERIESKLRIGRKLLTGYVPISYVDLDLRHFLSYNNYEGFRLGAGGVTNERFSRVFKIDGYYAFGTKDQTSKFSIGSAVRIGKFSNTWFGAGYSDDIREIASTSFTIDKRVFKLYDPRPINISTFYNFKGFRTYVETKIVPKTESVWQFQRVEVTPLFSYLFDYNGRLYDYFTLTTLQASLQWNPFSDFMQTPTGRVETYKRYPRFTFQVTKSVKDLFGGDFDFQKLDIRVDYQKKFISGERFVVLLEAGMASGAVPLTHLYNTAPNNLNRDRLLQRITIAGKNSFETMYFNEFFSSSYAALHLKHGFKPIQITGKIKPLIVLVTRGAIGTMQNPERHVGIPFKTLDKGFLESGVELNKIYSGFGLSAFYRYGPNQLPRLEDNLALKLSFMLNLGF